MAILNKNTSNLSELRSLIKELNKQLEKERQEKQNDLNSLNQLNNLLSVGYFQYNFSNESFLINDSLKAQFENCFDDIQISPKLLIESVHPEDTLFIEDIFTQPKPAGKKISGQFKLTQRIKDNRETKYFLLNGIYYKNPDNQDILTCAVRDITKETKQIKDLQRNLDKSTESDKIKTLFLLNISHNIRTPMNSILGFAELLNMHDPGPERRKEFIQIIKKQSKSLLQLIDNLAEIAKYESGALTITKTPVNLNLLIKEIVRDIENIRSEIRKENVKIIVSLPVEEGIEIFIDAGRLHQIFINLINHSLKYTLKGYIELGYRQPAENKIDFFVKDTSQGLEKEDLKNIFDRFGQYSGDESSRYNEETSLMLNIAKSIVKLLGGKINFDVNADTGFIFEFTLPYEPPPSQIDHTLSDDEEIARHYKWNGKVILIVEDEEVNGLFLEAVFQETGAQTLYAKNGKQAIELCKSINKIDIILMDIKMPVMNGIKATQEIKKLNKNIPIIAQTALFSEEDRENCLLAGCDDAITKPIEVGELLQMVNKYFT